MLGIKWKDSNDEEKNVYLFLLHDLNDLLLTHRFSLQVYFEQAARDKMRAEEEKAAYDVRLF